MAARGRREASPVLHDFCCVHGGTELHRGAVPCWCRARLCHCLHFFFCGGAESGVGQVCCWGSRHISGVLVSTKGGVERAAHVLSQVDDGKAARWCRVCVCVLTGQVNDLLWGRSSRVSVLSCWEPLLWWHCSRVQEGKGHQPSKRKQGQRPFCLSEGACGPELWDQPPLAAQLSLSLTQALLLRSPQGSCPHASAQSRPGCPLSSFP